MGAWPCSVGRPSEFVLAEDAVSVGCNMASVSRPSEFVLADDVASEGGSKECRFNKRRHAPEVYGRKWNFVTGGTALRHTHKSVGTDAIFYSRCRTASFVEQLTALIRNINVLDYHLSDSQRIFRGELMIQVGF